jgi:predicted MFS family arabinose efflux permease
VLRQRVRLGKPIGGNRLRGLARERNFVLLALSGTVSQLGDWALLLILPFYVYQRTGSVVSTGVLVAVELAPRLFISSVAGVLVDRWDRRWTMIGADLVRAVLMLGILLPLIGAPLWIVYAVALLEAAAAQLFLPAQGAMLPAIVRDERDLLAANSMLATFNATTRLVGPPLGGLLFVTLGLTSSVIADSASFLLSGLAIVAIRHARPDAAPDEPAAQPAFIRELREGLRFIAGEPLIRALCLTLGIVMITQGLLDTVLVPFVSGVLHFGPVQLGVIAAAQGLGGLFGALGLGVISRRLTRGTVLGVALLLAGVFIGGFALARPLVLSAAFVFLLSVPMVVAAAWTETYFQQRVDGRLLGRVLGATETVSAAGILIGVVVAAVMGGALGPVSVLLLAAGVLLVAGALSMVWLRNARTTQPAPVRAEIYSEG